jgi:predicted esterase
VHKRGILALSGALDGVTEGLPTLTMIALLAALTITSAAAAPVPSPSPPDQALVQARQQIDDARQELVAHFDSVQQSSHFAVLLETRLDEDSAALDDTSAGPGYSAQDSQQAQLLRAQMTKSLVHQLATGVYHALSSVRGADEVVVRSPADGLLQPAAIYVPASYRASVAAPLVVLLHGLGGSETDIIAVKYFRELADATGTIVIAPYARGDIEYADPAPADVYALLDAARAAFNADPKRTFLAGYSMGGFGVFRVGIVHPDDWAGFMAIAGGPNDDDKQAVLRSFQGKPVYTVSGSDDAIVSNAYVRLVAHLLRDGGIPTGYYEQPRGTHSLATIYPAIERAWSDMLRGEVPQDVLPPVGPAPVQPMHPD